MVTLQQLVFWHNIACVIRPPCCPARSVDWQIISAEALQASASASRPRSRSRTWSLSGSGLGSFGWGSSNSGWSKESLTDSSRSNRPRAQSEQPTSSVGQSALRQLHSTSAARSGEPAAGEGTSVGEESPEEHSSDEKSDGFLKWKLFAGPPKLT